MMDEIKNLGVPAIVFLLFVRMAFDFLKKKPKEENGNGSLKEYRMEHAISQLTENMIKQTELLREMREDHKDLRHDLNRIETKVDRIN